MDDHEILEPGTRIRLSALGKKRCPKMTRRAGVVVAKVHHGDSLRILMDGSKEPIESSPPPTLIARRAINRPSHGFFFVPCFCA